ncbi:MAG: N-acetyltransferase [Spirochaetales bacterium]|nr:N-acetyltransferase [Spirochaetales bacterium]
MNDNFTVRPATVKDINRIFELTNQMAEKGLMLTRSKYKIITILQNFLIAADENDYAIGCGAFSLLWSDLGEIMALAVDPQWQKKGVGRELVSALISKGRFVKVPEIIVLTYQVEFFRKLGFTLTDKDKFPRKVWRECLECPKLEKCDETAMHMIL